MAKKDKRYDYSITVSIQLIIENEEGKILLVRRPKTWEWAPGRLSLPGGKIYKEETFEQAIKRKTKQELGFALIPSGFFSFKQIIVDWKQAHQYIFTAKYHNEEICGEMPSFLWLGMKEIEKMPIEEFSEYYYKGALTKYLSRAVQPLPMEYVESLDYTKLKSTDEFEKWFKEIINQNFDPEKINDYKKWKERK